MTSRILFGAAAVAAGLTANPQTRADDKAALGPAQKYLTTYDKNKDGSLARDELPAGVRDEFADPDTSKDGKLSVEELRPHVARLIFVPVPVEVTTTYIVEAADAPTLEQLQAAYAMLRKADANNDGTITRDEARAARDQAIQTRVDAALKRHDANGDGKISKDECPDPMAGMFKRADKNNDGSVTKDEMKACFAPAAAGSASNHQHLLLGNPWPRPRLRDRLGGHHAEDDEHQHDHAEDHERDLGDVGQPLRDAAEPEQGGDPGQDEEDLCPLEQGRGTLRSGDNDSGRRGRGDSPRGPRPGDVQVVAQHVLHVQELDGDPDGHRRRGGQDQPEDPEQGPGQGDRGDRQDRRQVHHVPLDRRGDQVVLH
ncbi:MAG: hypothetical protein K2X87_20090 [Gemmataceae bacterium]|nr:hypothetical protein [Gemmataceae bacterium]